MNSILYNFSSSARWRWIIHAHCFTYACLRRGTFCSGSQQAH